MNYGHDGFFVSILIMAIVTYALRVSPLLLWDRLRFGELLRRTLVRVPAIVLTAVILATLAPYGWPSSETPQYDRLLAFFVVVLAQYWFRSTVLSILVGLAVAGGLPHVMPVWRGRG
jgi:branched-subunit amino acid transport protein